MAGWCSARPAADGVTAEDITANIRSSKPCRRSSPGMAGRKSIEIRGEVYMERAAFFAFNAERAAAGEQVFANPAISPAGSLRQLDPAVPRNAALNFSLMLGRKTSAAFARASRRR